MPTSDHELKVGSTTKKLNIMRDKNGGAMYSVQENIPQYRDPLIFTMKDWKGGHGQYEFLNDDVYYDGQSIDTTQDGKIFLGPMITQVGVGATTALDATVQGFYWYAAQAKLMCWTTNHMYYWDSGTGFWVEAEDFSTAVIYDVIEYNGILYVALGASTKYQYSSDATTYTATDLTDGYAVKFFNSPNAAGTANVLWKAKTTNEISSTSDGRTVAGGGVQWSTAAYIGDTSNNITNIFMNGDNLLIGRTDNLFNYDNDGGVHPLMGDLIHNRSTNNFKYVTQYQTATYFSLSAGLGELVGLSTYRPMGPLNYIGDIGKAGSCVGLTSDTDYLYVAMDEGTNTHIYKGREVRRKDKLRWEWCPWVFLGTNECTAIKVVQHSTTDKRLWFSYGSYTGYVSIYDNPLADSNARFAPSGFIRFSYDYGTNPYFDKLWQSIVTETSSCSATVNVTPKYRKNAETSMTALTSAIITNGVVKTNLTAEVSGNRIQFELDLTNREPTTTYAADATTSTTTIVDSQLTSDTTDYYKPAYVYNTTLGLSGLISAYNKTTKTITHATITGQAAGNTYYVAFSASTPVITFFEARGIEKPETVRIHDVTYLIGDTPTKRTETLRTFLRGARTNTSLIKFADLRYGDSTEAGTNYIWVVLLPGSPEEVEILNEKLRQPELGLRCKFKEVSYTIS
jgi:hypothetical protein